MGRDMEATPFPVQSTLERIPPSTWITLAAIGLGWYGMAFIATTFGTMQHIVHFYDMATVIHNPSWLILGIGGVHTLGRFAFAGLTVLVLLAPLVSHGSTIPQSRLLYLLPIALMLICGVILYRETSQPYVTGSGAIGEFAARVANNVIGRGVDTIAKHISVGLGGYLSFAAALYLAYKGLSARPTQEPGGI
jgi:hypothetical protein